MMNLVMVEPTPGRRDKETLQIQHTKLVAEIRKSLAHQWGAHRKVLEVHVRTIDGRTVHGFVNLTSEATRENFLLDFEAGISDKGGLSSLLVDGKRIPVSAAGRSGRRA